MNFASIKFLYLFFPIVTISWIVLRNKFELYNESKIFLIVSSLFFLFLSGGGYVGIIQISISAIINYIFSYLIRKFDKNNFINSNFLLFISLSFNIFYLLYYKYIFLFLNIFSNYSNNSFPITKPLFAIGISYYTLQQIAFLVSVRQNVLKKINLIDYLNYVFFFPKILAGPMVFAREFLPQSNIMTKVKYDDVSVGLTFIIFGTFKKVIFGDSAALISDQIFDSVKSENIPILMAWLGTITYSIQLYFDFSGYSDIAVGVSRVLGFIIPNNFNSPYRSKSLIELWKSWHITMTRFFMEYVYNPISIYFTRKEIKRKSSNLRLFTYTVLYPTIITFIISGIWHGAGLKFILFGLINGIGLSINHLWKKLKFINLGFFIGWLLTFLTFLFSLIFIRASDVKIALIIFKSLFNIDSLTSYLFLKSISMMSLLISVFAIFIIFLAPNTQRIMRLYHPYPDENRSLIGIGIFKELHWQPSLKWSIFIIFLLTISIPFFGNQSPFVYIQF